MIHFLVCLYQRLKWTSQNSSFLKTEVTLAGDNVIQKIDLQNLRWRRCEFRWRRNSIHILVFRSRESIHRRTKSMLFLPLKSEGSTQASKMAPGINLSWLKGLELMMALALEYERRY